MRLDHHLTEGEPKTSGLLPRGVMHGDLPKLLEDVVKRFMGIARPVSVTLKCMAGASCWRGRRR
jgi:hypothetical protein